MRIDINAGRACRMLGLWLVLAAHQAFGAPYAYLARSSESLLDVVDVRTGDVRDSIEVGAAPFGVTVNPRGTRAYVFHYLSDSITVVDTRTASVEKTIDGACGSHWMAIPRDDAYIYVADDAGRVCKIDTALGTVVHVFNDDSVLSKQIAVSPDGRRLYATSLGTLNVYDTQTYALIAAVPTGYLEGLAVSEDGTRVYATNPIAQMLVTVDAETNTIVRATAMCLGDTYFLALSPDERSLFVTCSTGGVQRFDVASGTLVANIAPTLGFNGLAITPDGSTLYAPALNASTVTVISAETNDVSDTLYMPYPASFYGFIGSPQPVALVAGSDSQLAYLDTFDDTIAGHAPIGHAPSAVALSPNGERAYVANFADHSVSVVAVAAATTIATIPVADTPLDLAMAPDGRHVYVAHGGISVIDTLTNSVVAAMLPGSSSLAVVVSADGRTLYSANSSGIDVLSTETNALVTTIPAFQPDAFALSPDGSVLYALAINVMYEISTLTQTVTGSFLVNPGPANLFDVHAMAISPRGDRLYVPNGSADSIIVADIGLEATAGLIYVEGAPTDVAISADGAHLFVTVPERNAVEEIETATGLPVGTSPAIAGAAAIGNLVEPQPNRMFRDGFD